MSTMLCRLQRYWQHSGGDTLGIAISCAIVSSSTSVCENPNGGINFDSERHYYNVSGSCNTRHVMRPALRLYRFLLLTDLMYTCTFHTHTLKEFYSCLCIPSPVTIVFPLSSFLTSTPSLHDLRSLSLFF